MNHDRIITGLIIGLLSAASLGGLSGGVAGIVAALTVVPEVPADAHSVASVASSVSTDRGNAIRRGLTAGVLAGGAVWWMGKDLNPGLVAALAVGAFAGLASTAWGQWLVIVRLWLPLTGRLPWRLLPFLTDAHRRGVLRQTGAVYQFRHARLQDQLAATAIGR